VDPRAGLDEVEKRKFFQSLRDYRFPKYILDYKQGKRKETGRYRKRWKDSWAGRVLKAYAQKIMRIMMMIKNVFQHLDFHGKIREE
jgi:hypothetical protein